jgi:excisionase family DNA binding protein
MARMPDPEVKAFLNVAEVAEILEVTQRTVYNLIESGECPVIRVGRSLRIPTDQFLAVYGPSRSVPVA